MRILLVWPEFPTTYWGFQLGLPLTGRRASLPPLGLITLAALLPRNWELRLVDLNVQLLTDADLLWAEAVFVGGMRIQSPSAHVVLARARALGRRTAIGGPAVTTAPEEFPDADVLFLGEAEGRIDALARAIRDRGQIVLSPKEERPGLEDAPVPRYDLLNRRAYTSMSVQYSRGCPYTCEFCDIIEIYGRRPRVKTAAQVLREFETIRRLGFHGSVFVVDDNFIGHRPAVKALLPQVAAWQREHGYPFELYTEASVNLASDEKLVDLMVDAGFSSVFLGIETPSAEALAGAGKKQNLKLDLSAAVNGLSRRGLEVMAGFIVGFDEDDAGVFERQWRFISESPIPLAMVGLLNALPGTQLWRRLRGEGRLREAWGGDQFARPNFVPKLDERTLVTGYADLLERLYMPDAFFDRVERHLLQAAAPPGHRRADPRELPTLWRTAWEVGVRSGPRGRFWRLLQLAATRAPHAFPWAVAHAVMGHHMIRYTREEVLPRLERALRDIRDGDRSPPRPPAAARSGRPLPVVSA